MNDDLTKRRETYLEKAEEAERIAEAAKGQVARDTFKKLAASWRHLAEQLGRSLNS